VDIETKNFEFKGGIKSVSIGLILVGIAAFLTSFSLNKTVGWVDYYVFNLYFVTMAVSAIFFLALNGVIQGSWLTPYKRIPEAMTKFLPVSFIMIAIGCLGLHTIYEWTHKELVANDHILREKVAWLNEPRFIITLVVIFVIWIGVSSGLRKYSDRMDNATNGVQASNSFVGFCAISIILFAITICLAGFDWIMSIEPHWFSTIFGVYVFAGSFVSGICFVTLAVIKLRDWGYLKGMVTDDHLHDLAKWMFGMSVFWAYMWISQYLLIWYANIPEETEYYVLRHHHWNGLFFFNLGINFFFPFFALMTRKAKRSKNVLTVVALTLLLGHFVDMYVMVAPKVFEHANITSVSGSGVLQILQLIGGFGLFIFVVGSALAKRKLVPTNDPTFSEGQHLHQ
jgi:MFS family permease